MKFLYKPFVLSLGLSAAVLMSGCKKSNTIPANSTVATVQAGTPVINADGSTTPAPEGGQQVLFYPDGTIHAIPAGMQLATGQKVTADTPAPAPAAPAPAAAPAPVAKSSAVAPAAAPVAAAPVAPAAPAAITVPSGTRVPVRITQTLSSKTSDVGEGFSGVVAQAVTVRGGTAFPRGTKVSGTVVASKGQGRFKGAGVLAIQLTSIGGYPVESSEYVREEKGKGKRSAGLIGGGAGGGALIGGLAGGGKGALIGGLIGGGAGTAGAAYTGNKDIVIASETVVTFELRAPVRVQQ